MNILAFESSCDETAAAVVRDGRTVLSDAILSQADMHALYGGVVPEIASRKHVEAIAGLTDQALRDAGLTRKDIDAVAVTYAPGLIGAVLVGVSFAKSAAYALGVPLIPVHHVRGHIAANYLAFPELEPPFLALAMSGGNTLIVDVKGYTDMEVLGATRDDAAGECFDKAARVLGLPYPGGKPMDRLAAQSPGGKYVLPRAHVEGAPLDMSFSGLKTALINTVLMTAFSLAISTPLGIFAAIWLVEYAHRGSKLVKVVRVTTETLQGIPSIVYGLFGMLFFVTKLHWGYSMIAGAFTLAIMVLPVIMRTTEEALIAVPDSYREGSFGLGAGKLRTVFTIVLPSAMPGILSGVILATGRIVGETAALIYTASSVAKIPSGVFSSTRTLAVHMYLLSNEGLYIGQTYGTAVVLLVLVLVINGLSGLVAGKLAKR